MGPLMYQPAPAGVWRSSPEHLVLWAIQGVLHRVEREIPEAKEIAKWETRLHDALWKPVESYAWGKLWQEKRLAKADPEVPKEILDEWDDTIGHLIGDDDGLWEAAATTRTSLENLPFDPDDLRAGMDEAFQLVRSIPDTMRDRLRTIMLDAYTQQKGQFAFARAIRSEFKISSRAKAEQIAVTEWNRAATTATLQGYRKSGVERKRWFTAGDNRVCSTCEGNSGEFDIPINQAFSDGSDGPPAHPSCRCNVAAG